MFCELEVVFCFLCFIFFFKQKTAYELRISDWSSDVCSSDLLRQKAVEQRHSRHRGGGDHGERCGDRHVAGQPAQPAQVARPRFMVDDPGRHEQRRLEGRMIDRSEEHTSELQSLMRSSYAVFCLKKKTKQI